MKVRMRAIDGSHAKFSCALACIIFVLLFDVSIARGVPSVAVTRDSDPSKSLGINFSGIVEPMILQVSEDLKNWSCLFLATAVLNGIEVKLPDGIFRTNCFFRLKALDEPIKFQANMVPYSNHLGRIVSGRELEIDFFGDRDAEGYANEINSVSYRIGDRLYVNGTETGKAASRKTSHIPEAVPTDEYVVGYVAVDASGACSIPSTPPVVQYWSWEEITPGLRHEISGEVKPEYQYLLGGKAIFKYKAPYLFSYPAPGPESVSRQIDGFMNALYSQVEPLSLAEKFFFLLAAGSGVVVAAPVKTTLGVLAGTSAIIAYQDGVRDGNPYKDYPVKNPLRATKMELRAVIPTGDSHYLVASQLAVMANPSWTDVGPTLNIEPSCETKIMPIVAGREDAYMRNDFILQNFFRQIDGYSKTKVLTSLGWDSRSHALTVDGVGTGNGTISLWPTPTSVTFVSEVSTASFDPSVSAIINNSGMLPFTVVEGGSITSSTGAYLEFVTRTEEPVGVDGRILHEGFTYHRHLGALKSVVQVVPGQIYKLDFLCGTTTERAQRQGGKSSVTMTLLGLQRSNQTK